VFIINGLVECPLFCLVTELIWVVDFLIITFLSYSSYISMS
jgi:hypothetical protein